MKKITGLIIISAFLAACNNDADSDKGTTIDTDSFNASDKGDLNNRNTVVYDTTQQKGDTGSYERMPGKVSDSIPH